MKHFSFSSASAKAKPAAKDPRINFLAIFILLKK
jgi:hypothetical protein